MEQTAKRIIRGMYSQNSSAVFGAVCTKEETSFTLWCPGAELVRVNLYRTGSDSEEGAGLLGQVLLQKSDKEIWQVTIAGNLEGVYYTYSIFTGKEERETADVYTRACGVNGKRSMVVNLKATDPAGFRQQEQWLQKRHQLAGCPVIYELHIKDFSHDSNSGISSKYRGKYLAFTEQDTTLKQGKSKTGIAYLKKLGITHVHLLPFFDYGSIDERSRETEMFNWGYDPVHYMAPEGSYSTDPYHGEVRIRECKQMIQALHEAGIGVIMDVVFNHTYSLDSVFQNTVPDYYYRMEEDGSFANGSMCGNDTASEQPMFRKYMIDAVCYWASEYQLDGFRFDLMGLHDVETMNQIRDALNALPYGKDILMYGEPWAADYSPMRKGCLPADKEHVGNLSEGIAIFCDQTRDSIKGDVFIAGDAGFVNREPKLEEAIQHSVCAWCDENEESWRPKSPSQIISYVSAHDNYTLWDKLVYTLPEYAGEKCSRIDFIKKRAEVIRQNKMAAGIYFTCLGTVFFQAGEEFGRTKLGADNSFDAPAFLNALCWEQSAQMQDLVEFYRGLIAYRLEHADLYGRSVKDVQTTFLDTQIPGLIAFSMMRKAQSEREVYVIYNQNQEKSILMLPEGGWRLRCDGNHVYGKEESQTAAGRLIVASQAVMILERV
ncbi:MAG: type I pullulanase [Lachnospiraceae bacterium]|nr:type I pullulanase [Lachnospiraceae bacterium]